MDHPLNILILEDRPEDVLLLAHELQRSQQQMSWRCVSNEPEYLTALDPAPDLILADYTMPGFNAMRALDLLQQRGIDIPLIVVSGSISEDVAVDCVRRGAADYLLKDRLTRLVPAIEQALDRHRTVANLRASEERFRVIFQKAPTGMVLGDLQGRVVQSNRAFQEMLGYSAAELRGMPFSEFTHPDDRSSLNNAYAELITGQIDEYRGERRYIHKNGHTIWGRPSATLVRGDNGQPKFAIIALEDITARRAIDETNARLAAIVDSSEDAIIGKTLDSVIVSWNDAATEMYGYTAAEMIGQSITLLIPADQPDEETQILDQIKRGERIKHYETSRVRKDGQQIDVSLTISPIRDANGHLIGASTIARDITQRKRASLALKRQTTFVEMLQDITTAANQTASLEEALQIAVEQICTHIGWPVGHVYLADDRGAQILKSTNIWHLENPVRYAIFQKITEALAFPGINDLPGRVLMTGLPEWIADISAESNVSRAKLIRDIGVRAGFAFPVLVGAEVAGVLEFFSPDTIEPDATLLDVMSNVGAQLGRVVERARSEAALRDSEERYRLIAENTGDIITLLDSHGYQIYVSPSIRAVLGYDPQALVGTSALDLLHPDDRKRVLEQWGAFEQTDAVQLALRCRHADGSWRWIEVHGTAMEQHGIHYALIASRDITERRQAEEALRTAEARYRTLVEQMPAIIYMAEIDERSSTQYVSPQIETILGYTPEEWLANPTLWLDLVHPDDRERVLEDVSRAQQSDAPVPEEYRSYTRDGRIVWLQDAARVVRDEGGQPLFLQGITLDITERKQAEEAVRTSERLYRTLASNFPNGAVILFDRDLRYTIADGARLADHGLSRELVEGKTIWEVFSPERVAYLEPLYRATLAGQTQQIEISTGGLTYDTFFLPVKDEHGDIFAGLIVSQDITERKQAEHALVEERALLARRVQERTADLSAANAELARTARLKDEFLASMSHELRTPLNAILGLSEALQEGVYGSLNERQTTSLRSIEESGHHLLDLINDILDLAKIGAGKLELEIEPAMIRPVCEASVRLIRQSALKKRLTIETSIEPAASVVPMDTRRIKQVLVNLLSNAVKFTPEGGSIGLEVVADRAGQTVQLSVWDTGIGIAADQLSKLFQPFVQLDSRLARQYEGTGLGLALVYRMVEMHGGSVKVTSKIGAGSRFTISLPWPASEIGLPRSSEQPADDALVATDRLPFRHALVIEDSPSATEQICRYLNDLGIATSAQNHGADSIDQAASLQPDLIILDLLLPDIAGWDVLDQLKADPRTQAIPVVIMSVVDERTLGMAKGAAGYIVKPYVRSDVMYTLALLTVAQQTEPTSQAGQPKTADVRNMPIVLLAEDNENNITTLVDYLHTRGYQVDVARNGAEALTRAREIRPDIILMDMQMPEMDGLEATRRIHADQKLREIPIIALTALAMPGDRERCLNAGASDYFSKPVSMRSLTTVLEKYLHQHSTDRPRK